MDEQRYESSEPSSSPVRYQHLHPLPHQKVNPRFRLTPESMGVQVPEGFRPAQKSPLEQQQVKLNMGSFQTLYRRSPSRNGGKIKRRDTPYAYAVNVSPSASSNISKATEKSEQVADGICVANTLEAQRSSKLGQTLLETLKTTSSLHIIEERRSSLGSDSKTKQIAENSAGDQPLKQRSSQQLLGGSDTARINAKLNEIFVKRIEEIESENFENSEIELLTYKEWVDMLLKINECIIRNTDELERQVAARLEMVKQKPHNDCCPNHDTELLKYRKDINALTQLIQNAYRNNDWDLGNLQLETISREQIFGDRAKPPPQTMRAECAETQTNMKLEAEIDQKNKILNSYEEGMKALASEVADRHDEIQMLKKQLEQVEAEMELSRQKVQMKETVIYQLRHEVEFAYARAINDINSDTAIAGYQNYSSNDPVNAFAIEESNQNANSNANDNAKASEHKSLPRSSLEDCAVMPPINLESEATERSSTTQTNDCIALKFIDEISQLNLLKTLEEELKDYFKLNEECNQQNIEKQGKRLWDIFNKWESEKAEAYGKLESLRHQLIDLESNGIEGNNDSEQSSSSNNENDQDYKIIESVRNRLRKLNEATFDLRKKVQKLELEKNELETNLQVERNHSQCSSQTLKELADQLCGMINKQFSYADIYSSNCGTNPFCEAITQIKNEFHENENKLLHVVAVKNKQIIDLSNALFHEERDFYKQRRDQLDHNQPEHQPCLYLEAVVQYCEQKTDCIAATRSILHELKNDLDLILCEVIVEQQMGDIHTDHNTNDFEAVLESTLLAMQLQNVKLEETLKRLVAEKDLEFVKLQLHNKTLKGQIDHLQHVVVDREKRITQLTAMISHMPHMPHVHCGIPTNAVEYKISQESQASISQLEEQVKDLTAELKKSQRNEMFLHTETRKLNEELNENKRKNENLNTQNRNLAALLKSQEKHRLELASKYEILENNYSDQAKQLRTAHLQLNTMKERILEMEKKQCEHDIERKFLREEVLSLKEKEADLMGKQKSMQEQVLRSEKELYSAHDVIREQQTILQQEENSHKEALKRLQDVNADMKNRLTSIMNDYKCLQAENEKLEETCRNNEKLLESFRKWKEAQLKSEERTRDTLRQYEENIRVLLQEKQRFVEQYRSLDRDYIAIQNELDRLNICSISMQRNDLRSNNNDNTIAECYQVMRQTADCITGQYKALRQEAYHGAYNSRMNSEDPL